MTKAGGKGRNLWVRTRRKEKEGKEAVDKDRREGG